MMQKLYLVRHTAVAVPPGVCYGRSDVAVLAPVSQQAAWLGTMLPAGLPVYSSPLSRCLLLAQAITDAPVVDARLAEMDFGEWELQRFDDIPRAQIDAWAADPLGFRAPGGETGNEVMARTLAALADVFARGEDVAIVSHGGPLRAIRGSLLGLPGESWLAQEVGLGSLTVLRRDVDRWQVEVSLTQ